MFKNSVNIMITAGLLLGITACGGGGSDDSTSNKTAGHFIDSPVEGLNYECDTVKGVTDSNGTFFCEKAPITFKLGEMTLGTLNAFTKDTKVYPQDLLELPRDNFTDEKLIKLIRLLQSIDDDGDITESINITSDISKKYSSNLNFETAILEVLTAPANGDLIDAEDAIAHLQDSMGSDAHINGNKDEDTTPSTETNGIDVEGVVQDGIKGIDEESNETSDSSIEEASNADDIKTDTPKTPETPDTGDLDNDPKEGDIGTGFYVDSAIEGVQYDCGSESGITDSNGTFTFEEGKRCIFTLGEMVLREVNPEDLENKMTLVEDNLETAQLLQSLDTDNDADNGIEIGKEVLDKIIAEDLTQLPVGDDEIKEFLSGFAEIEGFEGELVQLDEVKTHLEATKKELERLEEILITEEDIESTTDGIESMLESLG